MRRLLWLIPLKEVRWSTTPSRPLRLALLAFCRRSPLCRLRPRQQHQHQHHQLLLLLRKAQRTAESELQSAAHSSSSKTKWIATADPHKRNERLLGDCHASTCLPVPDQYHRGINQSRKPITVTTHPKEEYLLHSAPQQMSLPLPFPLPFVETVKPKVSSSDDLRSSSPHNDTLRCLSTERSSGYSGDNGNSSSSSAAATQQ